MVRVNPAALSRTSRNRDRALARLNSITTGTAIVAAVATVGFGALAAANYSGTTNAATTVAGDDAGAAIDPAATGSGAAAQAPTPTGPARAGQSTATGLTPTNPPVAAVKKKARVTTGGSH